MSSKKKKLDVFAKRKNAIRNIENRKSNMLRDTTAGSDLFSKYNKRSSDEAMSVTETSDDEENSVRICRNKRVKSVSHHAALKKPRKNENYIQTSRESQYEKCGNELRSRRDILKSQDNSTNTLSNKENFDIHSFQDTSLYLRNEIHRDSTNSLPPLENKGDKEARPFSPEDVNSKNLQQKKDISMLNNKDLPEDKGNGDDDTCTNLKQKMVFDTSDLHLHANKEDDEILAQYVNTDIELQQLIDDDNSKNTDLNRDNDDYDTLSLNDAETSLQQKKIIAILDSTDLPSDSTNLQEKMDIDPSKTTALEKKTNDDETLSLTDVGTCLQEKTNNHISNCTFLRKNKSDVETLFQNDDASSNLQQKMDLETLNTSNSQNDNEADDDTITKQQQKYDTEIRKTIVLLADKEKNNNIPSFSGDIRKNIQQKMNLENNTTPGNKENNEFDSYEILRNYDTLNVLESSSFNLHEDIADSQCTETYIDNAEAEASNNLQSVVDAIRNDVNLNPESSDTTRQRSEENITVNLDDESYSKTNEDVEKQTNPRAKSAFKSSYIDFVSDNEDFSSGSSDLWTPSESEGITDGEGKKIRKKKKKNKSGEKTTKKQSPGNDKVLSRKKVSRVNKRKSQREFRIMGKSHETRTGTLKEGKSLKMNPCEPGKCARICYDISDERRKAIFDYYWTLDEQRRRDWVVQHSKLATIKRKKTKLDFSRRNKTYEYFINEGEGQRQVCQKFLINTLDVTQKYLVYTIEHSSEGMAQTDQRSFNTPLKYSEESKKYAREFLDKLPAVSSHYCRRQSKKLYLPQDLKNIANLYRLYSENCKSDGIERISEMMFRKIFNEEYNLSFHIPKKDKCVKCVKAENNKDLTETEQNDLKIHLEEKKASYRRFKVHQNLLSEDTVTTSFDLQKVLNTPYGESMLLYYSRKYSMYNLAFYESQTQNGFCYLWGECDAKRGSNEIATCVTKYLKDVDERGKKNVLLYCDACSGQNKNKVVLTSLHHFLKTSKNIQVIQINYLLPGHSYMPVDSMHAVIEREVKKIIVWSPSQWPTIIEAARKNPFPYKVEVLEYSDILDWNELAVKTFKGDPIKNFQKIRIVTFKKKKINTVEVKYSMRDNAETLTVELMQNPKTRKGKGRGKNKVIENSHCSQVVDNDYQLCPLYSGKQPISQQKYDDLRKLCVNGTIPRRFHSEYLSLPTAVSTRDRLPETDEEEQSTDEDEAS